MATRAGSELHEVGPEGPRLVAPTELGSGSSPGVEPGAATRRLFGWLRSHGVGAGLVVVVGREPESRDFEAGSVPDRVARADGGWARFAEVLADQLERRRRGDVPGVDEAPGWALVVEGFDPGRERARASLLTIADGRLGTTGSPVLHHPATTPHVLASNVYDGSGPETQLLECPVWYRLPGDLPDNAGLRRVLDLRTGVLHESIDDHEAYRSLRWSSLARPGTVGMRVDDAGVATNGQRVLEPATGTTVVDEEVGPDEHSLRVLASQGGVAVSARSRKTDSPSGHGRERIAVFAGEQSGAPSLELARSRADDATAAGFDRLLLEHREAWAARWDDADIVIESDQDADLQLEVRFALHPSPRVGRRPTARPRSARAA